MNHDTVRIVGEGMSLGIIVATIAQWLPSAVALMAFAWYAVLFYDRFKKKKQNEIKTD